jgi:chaperonin GroES
MARKDLLASGQRTAKFIGGMGKGENLRKVSTEPRSKFVAEPNAAPKKMLFHPAGDVLLIRRNIAPISKTIEMADSVEKEKPNDGLVLSIGPKVQNFYVNQTVVFGKYAGTILKLNGEDLIMAKEDEMLGTLDEEKVAFTNNTNVGVCCSKFGPNGNGA